MRKQLSGGDTCIEHGCKRPRMQRGSRRASRCYECYYAHEKNWPSRKPAHRNPQRRERRRLNRDQINAWRRERSARKAGFKSYSERYEQQQRLVNERLECERQHRIEVAAKRREHKRKRKRYAQLKCVKCFAEPRFFHSGKLRSRCRKCLDKHPQRRHC
jgi:hypothetical protein